MIRRLTVFLALAAVVEFSAYAKATAIQCPQSILEKPSLPQAPTNWTVVADADSRPLEQAGIYVVIGGEYSAQVPDSTTAAPREERVRWRLTASPTETYWIGCAYTGTTAKLLTKVAAGAEWCDVSYVLLPSGKRQRLDRIDCR
jgi:hypothetical protein